MNLLFQAVLSNLQGLVAPIFRYLTYSAYPRKSGQPEVADFVFGSPQDMPLPEFVKALQRWVIPRNKDWFAYKRNEPQAQKVVAESLRQSRKLPCRWTSFLPTEPLPRSG